MRHRTAAFVLFLLVLGLAARGEDGYRLWLRYDPIPDLALRSAYAAHLRSITLASPEASTSPSLHAAREELRTALGGLLNRTPDIQFEQVAESALPAAAEAYAVKSTGAGEVRISGRSGVAVLYGAFALLRHLQTHRPPNPLNLASAPRLERRLLNHWDNLDGFVERGFAGNSLWEWSHLPATRSPRYRDYARALASLGLNGSVVTNVNANARILTPAYLTKVAALAEEFRPYGVRLYLTARFSAPIEIGQLKTADPLEPAVASWWKNKVREIYEVIPDFGGFVVKANSEGQPGPQDYHRTHADGANLLADALAPHGGIVMWRAFVYRAENNEDRVKQAYSEFAPLDGQFRPNVVVQIKNGPLDFMPREPFHPLLGGMPRTPLALELQITQEYLGQAAHLAFLAPLWQEVLSAQTHTRPAGATVAQIIDGSFLPEKPTVICGVANTGQDRNWTGHPLAQANWYAFGRLAWDPALSSAQIAEEWTRQTYGSAPAIVRTLPAMLLSSRETVVNYSMPLGLHHIMAEGHHFGPGPWVDKLGRADWTSVYYHRASPTGLGFDRTATGSNALAQYAPELVRRWGSLATCPEELLLWFHHVPWNHRMKSGRTLWDELCRRYQQGVDEVRTLLRDWDSLQAHVDAERHGNVRQRLIQQERDACEWRDACLLYFQTFSGLPLPAGVEKPAYGLEHYVKIKRRRMPGHPGDR